MMYNTSPGHGTGSLLSQGLTAPPIQPLTSAKLGGIEYRSKSLWCDDPGGESNVPISGSTGHSNHKTTEVVYVELP